MAAPFESASKLNNQTKRYQQLCILNICAAILTFMTEYEVPGVRQMCSCVICKQIM